MSIYLQLTSEFNDGRCRAIITSGQAVVLHRLAIMSKDGDWILREDDESLAHILKVLGSHGAKYRFGAPLDARWLANGWSSHFEFSHESLRVRTDFFTRPPRLNADDLARLWREQEGRDPAVIGLVDLAMMKRTNRERDYAVIGELARRMTSPRDQLLHSRSARDLVALAAERPNMVEELTAKRPLLASVARGREVLEAALDVERRRMMHANEERLATYAEASAAWRATWPKVSDDLRAAPLAEAHRRMVSLAETSLPFEAPGASP